MANYVIVEVTCRVVGKVRANLPTVWWFGTKCCPKCGGRCATEYQGHGFTTCGLPELDAAEMGMTQQAVHAS